MSARAQADYEPSARVTQEPDLFSSAWQVDVMASSDRSADPLPVSPTLEHEFEALAQRWRKETRYWSSATKMAMHPAYQRIIALGEKVMPYILNDLHRTRSHWLWALYVLSGFEDPAEKDATFDEAVDAWLNWGRQKGL